MNTARLGRVGLVLADNALREGPDEVKLLNVGLFQQFHDDLNEAVTVCLCVVHKITSPHALLLLSLIWAASWVPCVSWGAACKAFTGALSMAVTNPR